jgi:hypothetical protein
MAVAVLAKSQSPFHEKCPGKLVVLQVLALMDSLMDSQMDMFAVPSS